jgi:hypothetical protein
VLVSHDGAGEVAVARTENRQAIPSVRGGGSKAARDLQARYERLLGLVLRTGAWLEAVPASGVETSVWEGAFAEHCANLRALQALRDRLHIIGGSADEEEGTIDARMAA